MSKIDTAFIAKQIKQEKKLGDTAIKLSDRKRATERAAYLVELLKKANDE